MFTFLKLIKPFFLPPTLIALGMILSLILLWRKKERWGKIILILTLLFYYLLSLSPTAYWLSRSLEKNINLSATVELAKAQEVQAIVVLAGGAYEKEGDRLFGELSGISWKRLWQGLELYKKFNGQIPILYSGGSGDPYAPISTEAELAKQYAIKMGILQEKFFTESASRNTHENAVAVKSFLENRFPKQEQFKIILVTSARHLERSLGVMRKVGISAIPAAADLTTSVLKISPLSFFPSVASFSSSIASIHEWVGIFAYSLLGWI